MRRGPIWLYDLGQIFDASEKQEELIRHAPLESVAIVDGAHRRVRCAWLGRCLFTSWMALRGAQETDAECPAGYPAYESECSELRAQSSSLIVCVSQPAPRNASEGPLVHTRTVTGSISIGGGVEEELRASACAARLRVITLLQNFTRAPRRHVLRASSSALISAGFPRAISPRCYRGRSCGGDAVFAQR